ncbi:MAG: [protein-PII] uridylyltransferase [Betaproteobacteria bacterium RIFCSPLOWO2_12_FULL_62_58]|nr:MAG: [protein-PII] uridylyltransferase [Betaproteobacteria bacterium RIFCSPLOWO2_02_FULL_62_79]OGA48496.1 MAG: [protein-PII] uridylyltransferase [Betaproteobacteria bacterium RIFCSPLOWO2_12_FULL_62_58]
MNGLSASTVTPRLKLVAGQWKSALATGREALRRAFLAKPAAGELLRRHSKLIDRQLRVVWSTHAFPPELALLAVGGYGRSQLFPHSDIDLLVLLPAAADTGLQQKLETFIGTLWDIGLEVGHSVRTIAECAELSGQDVTVQTSLLEARLLSGNRDLFRRFVKTMHDALDAAAFMQAKQLEQQQRHERYQETNLEPNIKESAGGLRDLQNILWIARAGGIGNTWRELARRGLITLQEAREIQRDELFLQVLRIRLHYLAARREDRLLFDHQSALAAQFNLRERPHRLASEQLMQRYYRTAKAVSQLNAILLQNLKARISPVRDREYHAINPRFGSRGELLEARDEQLFDREPGMLLEGFLLLQQRHELKGMTATTLRALWRARRRIDPAFRRNPANRERFMQILQSPSRVERALRRMNHYGILGRYLPAFGRIVGQMQHDLYHVYTVDEHILRVIRNLRRFSIPELAHEFPLCSRLMSDFARPEVLYLAALFHDIAKGRGGDHSQLGKVDARRFCQAHALSREDSDLVSWLVEHHLTMSVTAQKQDLSDPDVIRVFAQRVGDGRRLAALYLLTVADIRGTSPKVWNAWKAKLLEDLFRLTRRLLAGDRVSLESSLQARQQEALAKLRLYALPDHAHEKLWDQLDTAYFLRHDPQEIAWHTRLLYFRMNTQKPVIKARLSPAGEGLQVMVYIPDQKELFARICSFFERISYDIFEAKIYTTRHGYALDSFQVHDSTNRRPQYRDLISYIEHELGERLLHQTPLPPLTKPRLSRQLRHFPISPEVNIQPDDKGTYKVLSVIAGDRPGLLSRIARVLTAYDINLHTAMINTLGWRAEDTFLITGAALNDPKTVVRFESDLVEQLRT